MRSRREPEDAAAERFVVEATLGSGGMGTVYLARDRTLERPVALKVLASHLAEEDEFRERFLREARLAARLVHPNVVQVYDVGEDQRGSFIVMEYVDGETLADELARRGPLPPAEVVSIGIQVCSALEAAHAEQLVHRDIKPRNILRRRGDEQVKLTDFGIARSLAVTSHTEVGTVLGTAAYLAPEQARGEPVTAAADIYALGVVLYELLTGRTPIEADTLPELVLRREQGEIPPPSELSPRVPAELEAVIMRCLAVSPEYRPASAAALAAELAASIDEPVTAPLPRATVTRATQVLPAARPVWWRRREALIAAALAVLLVAGIALAVVVGTSHKPHASAPPRTTRTAPTTTAPTTTAPTTTAPTTTAPTTTTPTTTATPPPPTPAQAIASTRATISSAEASGGLDPKTGDDLNKHLDQIAQSLAKGDSQDAAKKTADLLHHLGDLGKGGKVDSTALAQVTAQVQRLASLLPAVPGPRH